MLPAGFARNALYPVLDFTLMDGYREHGLDNLYNQVRGAVLELYLEELLLDRFPFCVVIPETEYCTPYGTKRSPDLCIIDPNDKSLIVIEVKARRLSPPAAVNPSNDGLDRNHGPAIDALLKLPAKIEDLYSAPEFEAWQGHLERIPKERAILVSVVGSTIFFHDELEPLRARLDPNHLLAEMRQPFCFLDLLVFEKAVELAHKHQVPLAQLCREHYEDTRLGDFNTPAARYFRNREMPEECETFAWRFL